MPFENLCPLAPRSGVKAALMKPESNVTHLPKQFREKLREQSAMLAFAHVIVRDRQGRITFWSELDAEIYGWTADEAVGQDAAELLRTEFPEPRSRLEERAASAGRWEGELVHQDRSGARHFLKTTWTPHHDENGKLIAFIEVNCDITRQKFAEANLRARDRDFRTFFELNGVGNVIAEVASGNFLTVNQTFCDLTGYSPDELKHLNGFTLTHPDDRDRDAVGWRASLEKGHPHYTIEKRYVRRDGGVIWVSVTSTIIRDDSGRALYAAGVVIDVTTRHDALVEIAAARSDLETRVVDRTLELREANVRLDQISKKFETLIDASPAAVIAVDHEQRVEMWNPEAEALFGLREDETRGRPLMELPIDWNHPSALVAMLLSDEARQTNLAFTRPDGRLFELGIWCASYPARDSLPGGHVLLMLDETQKKFLEHALLDSGEREQRRIGQELHEQLAQQLVGAAFGVQALNKELAAAHSPSAERAKELVRVINDSVVRARDMARAINPIEIDSEGLMSALREFTARAPVSPRVELDCDEDVLIHRSSVALHAFRIVQEAVTNAIRHAQASRIVIRISQENGDVTLSIHDDGRGIPAQTARDAEVGIGIMRYRAQAIRGEFAIETRADAGTTVTCTFPNPA